MEEVTRSLFADLQAAVLARTPKTIWTAASVDRYTTSVKLDIEARGLISRHGSPQVSKLTKAGQNTLEILSEFAIRRSFDAVFYIKHGPIRVALSADFLSFMTRGVAENV